MNMSAQVSLLVFMLLASKRSARVTAAGLAPIGAFGAIAAVVGATGFQAIISMATHMGAFYIPWHLLIVVDLGDLHTALTGLNISRLMN